MPHFPRAAHWYRYALRKSREFTGPGKHESSRLVECALQLLGEFAAARSCTANAHAKLEVGMLRHHRTRTQGGVQGMGPVAGSVAGGARAYHELLALWCRGTHHAGCTDSSSMLENGEWAVTFVIQAADGILFHLHLWS